MPISPRERLIVALDLASVEAAETWWRGSATRFRSTRSAFSWLSRRTCPTRRRSTGAGKQVFLDLKLHDIGNTVEQGVKSVARLGATFLTVHAYPQAMQAAVEAREGSKLLRILAVTVLTSYDDERLSRRRAMTTSVNSWSLAARCRRAFRRGRRRLVCSPEEAANVRAIAGAGMAWRTPGIRPAGAV